MKSSEIVEKKYVGRWSASEHKIRIKDQFTKYPELFDIVEAQGYENSKEWFAAYK